MLSDGKGGDTKIKKDISEYITQTTQRLMSIVLFMNTFWLLKKRLANIYLQVLKFIMSTKMALTISRAIW